MLRPPASFTALGRRFGGLGRRHDPGTVLPSSVSSKHRNAVSNASAAVVICADGLSPEYVDVAVSAGRARALAATTNFIQTARGQLPSFTNVNNVSIVTGVPPSKHGICGNYALLPRSEDGTGDDHGVPTRFPVRLAELEPVSMVDPALLRVEETILSAAVHAGWRVAILTAKDKLTRLLGAFTDVPPNNSSAGQTIVPPLIAAMEHPVQASKAIATWTHRVSGGQHSLTLDALMAQRPGSADSHLAVPTSVYSTEASIACVRVAAALVERSLVDLVYVSTTDYIQHKYAPAEETAVRFTELLDEHVARIVSADGVVGLTADHGMSAKQRSDGTPNVVYLTDALRSRYPQLNPNMMRVILPITDPYVKHHGALGSFACVYVDDRADFGPSSTKDIFLQEMCRFLLSEVPGVCEVHDRFTAAASMELPPDRMGDLVVLSDLSTVIGTTAAEHDLRDVKTGLRSHGGRYEEMVPFIVTRKIDNRSKFADRIRSGELRNFDIFDATLNGWRPAGEQ